MSSGNSRRIITHFLQVLALATFAAVFHISGNVFADNNIHITGTVINPIGNGIANAQVYVTDPGSSAIDYGPVTTGDGTNGSLGSYDLPIAVIGSYDIHFIPPAGSQLNSVIESSVLVMGNQTLNVQLTPVTHAFSGTFTDLEGNPIAGAHISLGASSHGNGGSGTTDSSGHFSFLAPADTYRVIGINVNTSAYPGWPSQFTLFSSSSIDLTTGDASQNLQVHMVSIAVTVKDSNGNPLSGVTLSGNASSTTDTDTVAVGTSDQAQVSGVNLSNTTTDSSGLATFIVPIGTRFGQSSGRIATNDNIFATLPDGQILYMPAPLTAIQDSAVVLAESATHIFSGTFTDQGGDPIAGATVSLGDSSNGNGGNGTTDASGHFSFDVPADTYKVIGVGLSSSVYPGWPKQFSLFSSSNIDVTGGNVSQNLIVHMASIAVTVKDSNNNLLNGVDVSGSAPRASNTVPIAVGSNDQTQVSGLSLSNVSTDSNGLATFFVPVGTIFGQSEGVQAEDDNIFAALPNGQLIYMAAPLTVSQNAALTLIETITHNFSGIFTDQSGNPIAGAHISLGASSHGNGGSGTTDSSGHFSFLAPADTYRVIGINVNTSAYPGWPSQFTLFSSSHVDLTANDISQSLLVHMVTVQVIVKDSNGNPINGVDVSGNAAGSNNTETIAVGSNDSAQVSGVNLSNTTTDSSGLATFIVPIGTRFGQSSGRIATNDNIFATLPDGQILYMSAPLTVSQDTTLLLQQAPPVPSTPSNLSVISPTRNPLLNWTTSSAASSYNIYRDGTKIDSSNTNSYADNTATEGPHSYYVTAVNSNGESGSSNTVTVLVDRTAPTITYSVSPVPNNNGWNRGSATVTFSCSDSASGVFSCPAPQTLFTDGANQTLTVSATDNAGNTATITTSPINIDSVAPTIVASVSPSPNINGWNNSSVTVTFSCADNTGGSGTASCTNPVTVSTETNGQTVTGTATDKAGNSVSSSVTIKLDETPPSLSTLSWSANPIQAGNNTTLTIPATDTLSGVSGGEYFLGTDPGIGNGTAMLYSSGNLSATFGSSLSVGVYTIGVRAKDNAGNWSPVTTTMLVVTDSNTTLSMTGKNKKDLIPSLANGDIMPGLISSNQTDAADYGMTVQYKNGSLDPKNGFTFNYSTGINCGKNNAQNCHTFTLSATSFAWLVINGTNNSQGQFEGTATVTVDGNTSTNPFLVSGTDGDKLTPTNNDYLNLKVYAPGANPSSASPIYQASGSMAKGNSVVIK